MMLQMPVRVKFIKRRGLDSLLHKISNHLPRIKYVADSDYALTKPILQQCPESKPRSRSWEHGGRTRCGSGAGEHRDSHCRSDPEHPCLSRRHHFSGDTGHVGRRRAGRAGLSANQITNVMWLQGLACWGGWEVKHDSLWPEGFNSILLLKLPGLMGESLHLDRESWGKSHLAIVPFLKKERKVAAASKRHFHAAYSGYVPMTSYWRAHQNARRCAGPSARPPVCEQPGLVLPLKFSRLKVSISPFKCVSARKEQHVITSYILPCELWGMEIVCIVSKLWFQRTVVSSKVRLMKCCTSSFAKQPTMLFLSSPIFLFA